MATVGRATDATHTVVTTYIGCATSTKFTQSHDEHPSVVDGSRWGPAAKLTGSSRRLKRFALGPVTHR